MSTPPVIMTNLPSLAVGSNSVVAARKAMTELGVAACVGAGCVHGELMTPTMISSLSKTTFGILLPMFLGTAILKTVSTYGLQKSSLAGPLLGVLQPFLLCVITSRILLPLMGIDCDSDDGRCTAVCSSWGNSGVIPLIFVESIFRNHENRIELLEKCYANISLFLVGWSPFFWSYGKSVLIASNEEKDRKDEEEDYSQSFKILSKLKGAMSPPVTGVSIGLLIAMIPPIRDLFVTKNEQSAPPFFATVFATFQTFGRAASPLSLLVLVSSLAMSLGLGSNNNNNNSTILKRDIVTEETSSSKNNLFLRQWACVSLSRFIVSPMLMLLFLLGFRRLQVIESYETDPILWFTSILQGCVPSAQNLVLMLQVANKQDKASAMAKFLFCIYTTSMIPVVLILGYALDKFNLS